MADVKKTMVVSLEADTTKLEAGLSKSNTLLSGLATAGKIGAAGVAAVAGAMAALTPLIERGQAFNELKGAFDGLYGATARFAGDGLKTLSTALDGTVRQLDILKAANRAAMADIRPDQFLAIAEAAETLGDKVGNSAVQALNDLTDALVIGNDRALTKAYGLTVDNSAAIEEYAKGLGKARDQLTEYEQKEGVRYAIVKKVVEVTKEQGAADRTAGDNLERLQNIISDGLDTFASAIAKNKALGEAIGAVGTFIKSVDAGPFITMVSKIVSATATAAKAIVDIISYATEGWRTFLSTIGVGTSTRDDIADLNVKIAELERQSAIVEKATNNPTYMARYERLQKEVGALKAKRDALIEVIDKERAAAEAVKILAAQNDKAKQQADEAKRSLDGLAGSANQLGKALKDLPEAPEFVSASVLSDEFSDSLEDAAYSFGGTLQDEMERNVDVFHDLFTSILRGRDIKDIFADIGIDLASTLAASLAQAVGLDVSGLAGRSTGSLIGDLIGSVLLGSGTGVAGTSGIGPVADGAAYGGALAASGANPWAAAAVVGAQLVLPTITKVFDDLFGGTKDPDTLARRGLRDELKKYFGEDLQVGTVRGKVDLTQVDYAKLPQFLASSPIGNEAVGLASTFAQVLGGGGKLGEDATAIFAQIVGEAGNFNEALINTLGIMDKLGMSAAQLKDSQKELFLDGKIELSEYAQAIQNLNFVAQENLAGTGSIADGWAVVTSQMADNRTKLKALELTIKEFGELGIKTFSEMAAYMMDRFGPTAAQVFNTMAAVGIDSADDIKNATADMVLAIFQSLSGLDTQVQATFRSVGSSIAQSMESGTQAAVQSVDAAAQKIVEKGSEIQRAWEAMQKGANDYVRNQASALAAANGFFDSNSQKKQGSFANNPYRP